MRIVLHCGQAKTGTTALQDSLWSARRELRAHGVCYPDSATRPRSAHKAITPLFIDAERVSTHIRFRDTEERPRSEVLAAANRAWNDIRREVERARPEVLVLSSETYCGLRTLAEARRLRDLLAQLTDDVVISLYVRDPADRYLSSLRQIAKSRGGVTPPRPMAVRAFLESMETAFGRRPSVRVYDRSRLIGGDIVRDFTTAFLGERIPSDLVPTISSNESLSSEAAALLLSFRRNAAAETVGFRIPEARVLRAAVTDVDASLPRGAPEELLPHVRAGIIASSIELDWLRAEYDIGLPRVDYPVSALATANGSANSSAAGDASRAATAAGTDDSVIGGVPIASVVMGDLRIEDVCVVDRARLEELTARVLRVFVDQYLDSGSRRWVRRARTIGQHFPERVRYRVRDLLPIDVP